jgi:hypothetical protein
VYILVGVECNVRVKHVDESRLSYSKGIPPPSMAPSGRICTDLGTDSVLPTNNEKIYFNQTGSYAVLT